MVQYEVCWPMGSASTGRAPQQLTESPFKYLKSNSAIEAGPAIQSLAAKGQFLVTESIFEVGLKLGLQVFFQSYQNL